MWNQSFTNIHHAGFVQVLYLVRLPVNSFIAKSRQKPIQQKYEATIRASIPSFWGAYKNAVGRLFYEQSKYSIPMTKID